MRILLAISSENISDYPVSGFPPVNLINHVTIVIYSSRVVLTGKLPI